MDKRWVTDKTDKIDSNRGTTIDVSPVRSIRGFEYVKNCLTDLLNINRHGTDTPNGKRIENGH